MASKAVLVVLLYQIPEPVKVLLALYGARSITFYFFFGQNLIVQEYSLQWKYNNGQVIQV